MHKQRLSTKPNPPGVKRDTISAANETKKTTLPAPANNSPIGRFPWPMLLPQIGQTFSALASRPSHSRQRSIVTHASPLFKALLAFQVQTIVKLGREGRLPSDERQRSTRES